jgi:hypothetical protein
MLAPFFLNLLMICSGLLVVGWATDLISGWFNTAHVGELRRSRPSAADRIMRIEPTLSFHERPHSSRRAVCRVH